MLDPEAEAGMRGHREWEGGGLLRLEEEEVGGRLGLNVTGVVKKGLI